MRPQKGVPISPLSSTPAHRLDRRLPAEILMHHQRHAGLARRPRPSPWRRRASARTASGRSPARLWAAAISTSARWLCDGGGDVDEIEPLGGKHLPPHRCSAARCRTGRRRSSAAPDRGRRSRRSSAPSTSLPGMHLVDREEAAADQRSAQVPPCSTRLCHLHQGHALLQPALRLVDDDGDDDDEALDHHLPEGR